MAAPKGNGGIYKITSPSGRVYIGQTINFRKRFASYLGMHCSGQVRLHASFVKYGVQEHIFEIIEECSESYMNMRERHYQDFYSVIGENGLNCKLTNTDEVKGRHSSETRMKISLAHTGKKLSASHIESLKRAKQNITDETKEKIRQANLGKKMSDATKAKQRKRMMGNTYTIGMLPHNAKEVICNMSGFIFDSASEAAQHLNIKRTTLTSMINGTNKNRTSMEYV